MKNKLINVLNLNLLIKFQLRLPELQVPSLWMQLNKECRVARRH